MCIYEIVGEIIGEIVESLEKLFVPREEAADFAIRAERARRKVSQGLGRLSERFGKYDNGRRSLTF
jgi:hypothetical protein